jgi:hypothetical protein
LKIELRIGKHGMKALTSFFFLLFKDEGEESAKYSFIVKTQNEERSIKLNPEKNCPSCLT